MSVLSFLDLVDQRGGGYEVEHYNRARPHRSLNLTPPAGCATVDTSLPITATSRFGGLIHEYSRQAA